ncbi:MAG: PAS domain S-box protein [Nitrospirota bacterium]
MKEKILIVEDEAIIAMELKIRLQEMGYDVPCIVASGEDAIDKTQKFNPNLILMDIMIQGQIDGIETARQIRSKRDVPIIYLSAYTDNKLYERAKDTGSFGYISKPVTDYVLHNTIEMALYKHSAEKALRQEKEFTEKAINAQIDTFFVVDPKTGKAIRWNNKFREITGYTDEEIADLKAPESYYSPEDLEKAAATVNDILIKGQGSVEISLICKDGRRVLTEYLASAIRDEENNIKYIISIGRDITERKKLEKERSEYLLFLENLERINRILRRAPDIKSLMVAVLDEMLLIFGSDRTWLAYPCDPDAPSWGVPMERTASRYPGLFEAKMEMPMKEEEAAVFRNALETEVPICFDSTRGDSLTGPTIEMFSIQSQIVIAIHPKVGKPWLLGMHQCSHQRIWTENDQKLFREISRRMTDSLSSLLFFRDLQESEKEKIKAIKEWESTFDSISDMISIHDKDFNLVRVNKAFCDFIKKKKEDIIGKKCYEVVHEYNEPWPECPHNQTMKLKEPVTGEFFEPKLGIYLQVSTSPIFDENGELVGTVHIAKDITDRKKAEKHIK